MIVSFGDEATKDLYHGKNSARARRFPADVVRAAHRKLTMLESAKELKDLRIPPGNRLEELRGALRDFSSIRVNDQWRLIFRWEEDGAHEVRLVDYH